MNPTLLALTYGVTIIASAVAGGYLPSLVRMTHVRMQMILSFVGGLMLGIAVLQLLPHSLEMLDAERVMRALLVGLLVTFLMMRVFQFHQHGEETAADHQHAHEPAAAGRRAHGRKLSWLGVMIGLSLHTFIDGLALGSAVLADADHAHRNWPPAGFGVFLAILLHKPLDAVSVASLMEVQGWSRRTIQAATACIAVTCPLGAIAIVSGVTGGDAVLAQLLAAAAGVFLCISLSDLLPEVQFHQHDRLRLTAALLLGIAVAYGIESMHQH
jgi:zinc and cadmium transporter